MRLSMYLGELRRWRLTITDRETRLPVDMTGKNIEVVVLKRSDGSRLFAKGTLAPLSGIQLAGDQTTAVGQATVTFDPVDTDNLNPGECQVMTWVIDDAGPQVSAVDELVFRSSERANAP